MPNIVEYTAPNIDLNPAERGVSAWDAAARRIGAFYGDVAGSQRAQGTLAAQALKMKLWPFDILALYDAQAKGAAGGGGGANFRVRNAGANLGGPTETFAGFGESRNTGAPYQAIDEVSRGAAALARGLADGGYQAAQMGGSGGGGGKLLLPNGAGGDKTSMAEAMRYANALFGGPDYTLLGGELMRSSDAARIDAEQRGSVNQEMSRYWQGAIDVQDYWNHYNGLNPSTGGPYGDPSGFTPNTSTGGYGGDASSPSPPAPDTSGSMLNPLNWF